MKIVTDMLMWKVEGLLGLNTNQRNIDYWRMFRAGDQVFLREVIPNHYQILRVSTEITYVCVCTNI